MGSTDTPVVRPDMERPVKSACCSTHCRQASLCLLCSRGSHSERADATAHWHSAEVNLAPLARSDYVTRMEFEKGQNKQVVLKAIRIVP